LSFECSRRSNALRIIQIGRVLSELQQISQNRSEIGKFCIHALCTANSCNNLLAFSATELCPVLIAPFFLNFAQRVLVEGYNLQFSMKSILAGISKFQLVRHTDIVHVNCDAVSSSIKSNVRGCILVSLKSHLRANRPNPNNIGLDGSCVRWMKTEDFIQAVAVPLSR